MMLESMLVQIMVIIAIGIGAQWIAWKFHLPAIVIMSVGGLLLGPVFGMINPEQDFGDLFQPLISVAVALVLFEGSLHLDFREIKGLGKPVIRLVTVGAVLCWIFGALSAHFVAGLSWAVSFVIGGVLIVTGPTVIMPLLRQAKLHPRPSTMLKWEGIIVDPLGALLAVFAFEIMLVVQKGKTLMELGVFFIGVFLSVIIGWASGKGVAMLFKKGYAPQFLKSPMVLAVVIFCFTISDELVHETGLVAVTVMGMTLANTRISSVHDLRHFKENISVLLISAIFVMLTSSLTKETLLNILRPEIIGFVILMMFVVRPLSVFLSTVRTDLSKKEKLFIGWIAPRGIVALTVSSYFASILMQAGFEDAAILTPLTFALVFATVCMHGFTMKWLADKLSLSSNGQPGVLFVGSNTFTVQWAKQLQNLNVPVLVADASWKKLKLARAEGIPFFHGEILSEQTEFSLNMTPYEYLIVATEYDSYNTLVCTSFMPQFGRENIYQLRFQQDVGDELKEIHPTIGGHMLFEHTETWESLVSRLEEGFVLKNTTITEQYSYEEYMRNQDYEAIRLMVLKASGQLHFYTNDQKMNIEAGDTIMSLAPPSRKGSVSNKSIQLTN